MNIGFRLARPDWVLSAVIADKVAFPAAVTAGVLQGATGVSAPVYIVSMSMFFFPTTVVQIPTMAWYGLLTPARALGRAAAVVVLLAAMPVRSALAKRISAQVFDRVILTLLAVIAVKLAFDAPT